MNAMNFGPATMLVGIATDTEQVSRLAEGWCPDGHGRLEARNDRGWCAECRAEYVLDQDGAWMHVGPTVTKISMAPDEDTD